MLMNEMEVDGYTIRPLTLKKLELFAPVLQKMEEKGIPIDEKLLIPDGETLKKLIPFLRLLLSILLDNDDIDNMQIGTIVHIYVVFISQNLNFLKNLLSPVRTAVDLIKKDDPESPGL